MRKKKTDGRALKIAVVVMLGVIVVGAYMLISGGNGNGSEGGNGDTGEAITSIDLRLQGFEAGSLGENCHYRAEGLGTTTPKLRIDPAEGEEILIFNYDENAEYAYDGSSWIKFPLTQTGSYASLGEKIQEWAQEGEGTYEVTYNQWSMKITINAVNPQLTDDLFKPPENADVKETETS